MTDNLHPRAASANRSGGNNDHDRREQQDGNAMPGKMGEPPDGVGWDGHERRAAHWHLKREITIGQIITLASLLVGGVSYVIQNENRHEKTAMRLDVQAQLIQKLEESDRNLAARHDATIIRIEGLIQRVDDKLNRLVEREGVRR